MTDLRNLASVVLAMLEADKIADARVYLRAYLAAPSEGMKPEPRYTEEQINNWINNGTLPVPRGSQEKLVDALSRCLWLLQAPGVAKSKAMQGYKIEQVIELSRLALKSAVLSPARSGDAPPACPECKTQLRDETAWYRCDTCHARYSSSMERGLYRLPDDRFAAPQTSARPLTEIRERYESSMSETAFTDAICAAYDLGRLRAAPQPVSGDAPEWIMKPCPKELAAIMSSPADWLITRVDGNSRHTLYFSNEELEKLCQGYLQVIPLERLKDLRATGDAPKVEERELLASGLAEWFLAHWEEINAAGIYDRYPAKRDALRLKSRPYFPPASQTPHVEKVLDVISGLIATYETGDHAENPCGDCGICTAEKILAELATPASTARTDALLNLLRAADDVLAEQSLINQRFTQKQDALFAELMGWRDANGILAAPGSVPQAPVAANTPCSEHKVFHPACADCWKEYYKSPAFCVPQAEPKTRRQGKASD